MKRFSKSAIAVCLALIMTCSCFAAGFAGYATELAETESTQIGVFHDDVGFVYPTSMTAKMLRPLYIGLDNTVKTDATYGEWNYFEPENIARYIEYTVTFSNGSTKTFTRGTGLYNSLTNAYSTPSFESTELNTASNPLKAGSSYDLSVSLTLNYRLPYTVSFDTTIKVEVAEASVTGIKAEASHAIPFESSYCSDDCHYEFHTAKPKVALTLSDGGTLPLDANDNEGVYQLYGQYIHTTSDQGEGNYWQLGEAHEFTVYFGREEDINQALFTTTMPVTIESFGEITSVDATVNEPFYEYLSAYFDTNKEEYEYYISNLDIDFKINFKKGQSINVKGFTDEFWDFRIDIRESADEWKAGNTYTVQIKKYYSDVYANGDYVTLGSFDIEVLPNPVESFEVMATAPVIFEDDGYMYDYEVDDPYYYYYPERLHLFYNVTFNDGRPNLVYASKNEVVAALGGIYITEEDQYKNHWELGLNTVTAKLGDVTAEYDVWVIENYSKNIKDVRVKNGVEVIEGMFADLNYDYSKPYGENIYYIYQQYLLSAEIEVELYDGTVITEYTGAKKYAITENKINGYSRYSWKGDKLTQSAEDYWEVGDTFNLTLDFTICNATYNLTVPVTVKENDTPFEFGYCYEDSSYSYGLGLSITVLKSLPSTTINIPTEVYGYKVKEIQSLNYDGWDPTEIEKIYLPDTVKSISDYAFQNMWGLEYINLNMVEEIGAYSLIDCSEDLEVVINPNNKALSYKNDVIYNGDMTEIKCITGTTSSPIIEPTVKTVHNTDIVYYRYNDLTITGMDTRLEMVGNSYDEPDPFPPIRCPKGSAAEADAIALGIDYVTFSDIPMDDNSAEMPVKITANSTANLPDDAVVNVSLVADTAENQIVYDITILSGGEAVQPEDEVTVTIDVPQGMQAEYCRVYRLNDDGSKTNMKATLKNGKLVFTTDHFSLYVVEEVIYTPGDVNDNDEVTLDDVVLLAQQVAGWDVEYNPLAGDTNGDDQLTLDDVVLLAQFVAGWDVSIDGSGQTPTPTPPPEDNDHHHNGCYFEPNGDGTHTAICDSCEEPLSKENCADEDADGSCDSCFGLINGTGDVDINIGGQP